MSLQAAAISTDSQEFQAVFDFRQVTDENALELRATNSAMFQHEEFAIAMKPLRPALPYGGNSFMVSNNVPANTSGNIPEQMLYLTVSSGTKTLLLTSMVLNVHERVGKSTVVLELFVAESYDLLNADYMGQQWIFDEVRNQKFEMKFQSSIPIHPGSSKTLILRSQRPCTGTYLISFADITLKGTSTDVIEPEIPSRIAAYSFPFKDMFAASFSSLDQTPTSSEGFLASNHADYLFGETAKVRITNINDGFSPPNMHICLAEDKMRQLEVEVAIFAGTSTIRLTSITAKTLGTHRSLSIEVREGANGRRLGVYEANGDAQDIVFSYPVLLSPGMTKKFVFRVMDGERFRDGFSVGHEYIRLLGTSQLSLFNEASSVLLKPPEPLYNEAPAVSIGRHLVRMHKNDGRVVSDYVDYRESAIPWTISRAPQGGFLLSSKGHMESFYAQSETVTDDIKYMSSQLINVPGREETPAISLTTDISQALIVVPEVDADGKTFSLRKMGSHLAVTLTSVRLLGTLAPLQAFNGPRIYQHWLLNESTLAGVSLDRFLPWKDPGDSSSAVPSEPSSSDPTHHRHMDSLPIVDEDKFIATFTLLDQTPTSSADFAASNREKFFHGETTAVRVTGYNRTEVPKNMHLTTTTDNRRHDLEISISSGSSTITLTSIEVKTLGSFPQLSIEVNEATAERLTRYSANGQAQEIRFSTPVILPPSTTKTFTFAIKENHPGFSIGHEYISIKGTSKYSIFHDAVSVLLKVDPVLNVSSTYVSYQKAIIYRVDGMGNFVDYWDYDVPWTISRVPNGGGFVLSSQGLMSNYPVVFSKDVMYMCYALTARYMTPAILVTQTVSNALVVVPVVDTDGKTFHLRQIGTDKVVTFLPEKKRCNLLPLEPSNSEKVYQHWRLDENTIKLHDGWSFLEQSPPRKEKRVVIDKVLAMDDVAELFGSEAETNKLVGWNRKWADRRWSSVYDDLYLSIACGEKFMYLLPSAGNMLKRYTFAEGNSPWQAFGTLNQVSIVALFAGGNHLLGLDDAGLAYRLLEEYSMLRSYYFEWEALNCPVPLKSLVAVDPYFCGLSKDTGRVYMCNEQHEWIDLGCSMEKLLDAGHALYGVDADGHLQRYKASEKRWEVVFDGVADSYAAKHNSVYLTLAKPIPQLPHSGVYVFQGKKWERIGGFVESLVISKNCLYGVRNQEGYVYDLTDPNNQAILVPVDLTPPAPKATFETWMFRFFTMNERFAGFDGEVRITVYGTTDHEVVLPNASFGRGHRTALLLNLPSSIETIHFLSISTSNWWGDQWHLHTVDAIRQSTNEWYQFVFKTTIAEYPHFTRKDPIGPSLVYKPPKGKLTVHAWGNPVGGSLLGAAVGVIWPFTHVSMSLPGHYISWRQQPIVGDAMPPYFPPNLQWDMKKESWNQIYVTFDISDVDTAKIEKAWDNYRYLGIISWNPPATETSAFYIYIMLRIGGALDRLSAELQEYYQSIMHWDPKDVASLSSDLMLASKSEDSKSDP